MKLSRADLWTLEDYAEKRPDYRAKIMQHKRQRQLALGEHVRLLFEDEQTVRYQIQEMLRIEKIFDPEGIEDELAAYNPLIPDGNNWKCTMLIEFSDPQQRLRELGKMVNIEHTVWMMIDGFPAVNAIANEDLDRSTDEKTSSVHFLRFELDKEMIEAAHKGASIYAGIEHRDYRVDKIKIADALRKSLVGDLSRFN